MTDERIRKKYPSIHALLIGRGLKWLAVAFLFLGCFQAWRDEHANSAVLIDQKSQVWSDYNQCDKERAVKTTLLEQITGQSTVQQGQIVAQQGIFNKCVLMLANSNKTEKLITQAYPIGSIHQYANTQIGKFQGSWIVVTNRTITPIRLLVTCEKPIVVAQANVLGTGMLALGGWGGKFSDLQYGIGVTEPAWTSLNPMLVTVYSNEQNIGNCTFEER